MEKLIKLDNQQEKENLHFNNQMIGWVAGFTDGEGHISLTKESQDKRNKRGFLPYRPLIIWANVNPINIARLIEFANYLNLPHYVMFSYKKKDIWARCFRFQIFGLKRCKKWLEILKPYLVGKKIQAEIVLSFIDYRLKVYELDHGHHLEVSKPEFDEEFKNLIDEANGWFRNNSKFSIPREYRPTTVEETVKMYSELKRKLESLQETVDRHLKRWLQK